MLGSALEERHPQIFVYSIFTSGAYRATAPDAAFPEEPGPPASSLAGVDVKPHFAALFRVEAKMP
jgi:hypothetical protein